MPEDAGKKRFIKDFLQQVKAGEGFIEDIWIERVVRPPGTDGEGSTATSLSMRPLSNITQLLEDDLRRSFDERDFTFRFVGALVGSGKTSLLTYLHELTKTKPNYSSLSVVVRFQLSDLLTVSGDHSFGIKLYCHILAQTLWELLHNPSLSSSVCTAAEHILSELLDRDQLSKLKSAKNFKLQFYPKFKNYLVESGVGFEDFFFEVLSEVSAVEPFFTFVYLTDELDALQQFDSHIKDTRSLFKALIKRARQQFKSKIRLLIYVVGTSDNVKGFIAGDSVIESILDNSIINLHGGYSNEFKMIRDKIDKRIEGAYKGYKNFVTAWQEIQNISLNPANNLRKFCQEYASAVLEIHEKYFREEPEKCFEGNARELVEAQCKQKWASYLNKAAYTLSAVSTTNELAGHAFDCYVELLHNGNRVARAFGEAKNYELLSAHFETFKQWLKDVSFKRSTSDGNPPDLAFMIAPSCSPLLQRKLELQYIQFIKSDKVTNPTPTPTATAIPITTPSYTPTRTPVNINTASKYQLINAFKGTGIKQVTIDKILKLRENRRYKDIDEMDSDGLISTQAVRKKLETKLNKYEICF